MCIEFSFNLREFPEQSAKPFQNSYELFHIFYVLVCTNALSVYIERLNCTLP